MYEYSLVRIRSPREEGRSKKATDIGNPHPESNLVSVTFGQYRMDFGGVGRGRPNTHLFAFVPSREREGKLKRMSHAGD